MQNRWILSLLLALGSLACAAGKSTNTNTTGDSTSAGGGQGGATSSTGGQLAFGGFGGAGNGKSCSPDLKHVVDSNGKILETCAPTKACLDGECVAPCVAAAASAGSIGCEFAFPRPEFRTISHCYAAFVVNTWESPAKLTVSRNGQPFNLANIARIPSGYGTNVSYSQIPASGLPAGDVAVLFLAGSCSPTAAVVGDTLLRVSGRSVAFEVTSDIPVKMYDLYPYGSGGSAYLPSASLLYPRTAWGNNYVAAMPHPPQAGEQWLQLVGTVDNTTVSVKPPVELPAGVNVAVAPANQITKYTLNKGEVLQWFQADAGGTIIGADQPVGAFSGNVYLYATTSTMGGNADAAHQQIPHVKALGSEYVGGNLVTRLPDLSPESTLYQLVGVVEGTQLSYESKKPAGAPDTLSLGQVVEFETKDYFVVSSQDDEHPFTLSQYMSGSAGQNTRPDCQAGPNNPNNTKCDLGGADWVMVLPTAQYLKRYLFFVDPTYATTNVVIARHKGPNGFADVSIACLGAVSGWEAVSKDFEVAHVDLVRGLVGVTSACETSVHEATSEGAFGITVWGTDYAASYAYPAGGNFTEVNSVYVPPELE